MRWVYFLGIDLARTGAFGIVGVCASLPKKLAAGLLATLIFDGATACVLSVETGNLVGALVAVLATFEVAVLDVVVLPGAVAAGPFSVNLKLGQWSCAEVRLCSAIFLQSCNKRHLKQAYHTLHTQSFVVMPTVLSKLLLVT
jgi:hypothetical protein